MVLIAVVNCHLGAQCGKAGRTSAAETAVINVTETRITAGGGVIFTGNGFQVDVGAQMSKREIFPI